MYRPVASCVQRVSADTWRLDFSVLGWGGGQHTRGGHDRVTATRDCGPVLTQLAKWPLQIESRPPATDIEQRDERERERERRKKKKLTFVILRHEESSRKETRGEGEEERQRSFPPNTVFPIVFAVSRYRPNLMSFAVSKNVKRYLGAALHRRIADEP